MASLTRVSRRLLQAPLRRVQSIPVALYHENVSRQFMGGGQPLEL